MTARPKKSIDAEPEQKFVLRIPKSVHDKLKLRTKDTLRSINNEILFIVKKDLSAEPTGNKTTEGPKAMKP